MDDISLIILHNRTSCCGSRLRDIVVSLHDVTFRDDVILPDRLDEFVFFLLALVFLRGMKTIW